MMIEEYTLERHDDDDKKTAIRNMEVIEIY